MGHPLQSAISAVAQTAQIPMNTTFPPNAATQTTAAHGEASAIAFW
jgi:hypothetical protein